MADTSNLSKFLSDVAEAIRTKKETIDTIPAKDFDTEILSIETGINTSDATATADNIENGYTAYVNGEKVSGTIITSLDTIITAGADATITDTGTALNVDRGYGKKIVLKSEQQLRSTIPYNTIANIAGLTPEKLMKGEIVLGVEGTAEGGGSTPVIDSDGPVHYIFNSEEEADAFTGFRFGDTATILTEQNRPMGISELINGGFRFLSTEINGWGFWHCQKNVTLNEPITYSDYVEIVTGEGNKQKTNTFSIDITDTYCEVKLITNSLTDECSGAAKWESADGINYTFVSRTSEDDELLDIDYFSLSGPKYGSVYLKYLDTVVDLFTKACEEFTNPDIFSWFFYVRAKDAFAGFWQVDADNIYSGDTDIPDMIYSIDLPKTRLTNKQSDCYIAYKHIPYNVVEDYPILQGANSHVDSTYGDMYVRKDNIYYILHGYDIKYYIDENEFYLCKSSYVDDTIERTCKKYDTITGKYTTVTERNINGVLAYDILTDPDVICYFGLNTDGTVKYHGCDVSVDVYQNKSAANHLYLQYLWLKGNLVISKNDFGMYTKTDDIRSGAYAITNDGVVKGTMVSSSMTKEEEAEAISILNDVLGGE